MDSTPCVIKKDDIIALCYADDLILYARYGRSAVDVLSNLNNIFRVKNFDKPKSFLGLDLNWAPDGSLLLGQVQLIDRLLVDIGMGNSKPVGSPLDQTAFENDDDLKPLHTDRHATYHRIVGRLLCRSTRTRPDLSVAISLLESHLNEPT